MNIHENLLIKNRGRLSRANRGRLRNNILRNVISIQRGEIIPLSGYASTSKSRSTSTTNITLKNALKNNDVLFQTISASTSRSARSYNLENDSMVILAITEGRGEATWEIGIAAIDLNKQTIILCQFADAQSYVHTLTKINVLNANEILVPNTFAISSNNRLLTRLKEHFKTANITAVPRSTFNKSIGLGSIQKLCLSEYSSVLLLVQDKYYALTAAAALINYVENFMNILYAQNSLKVEYQESEGYAIIDISTADNLELVASTCAETTRKDFSSLFDVLNRCLTRLGSRILRSSILQPSCSVPDIEARLDCVQELIENNYLLGSIQSILSKLTNIEQILSLSKILSKPVQENDDNQLNYMLLLNTLLDIVLPLHDLFEHTKQPFFIEVRKVLSNVAFNVITELMRALIQNDAHPAKGHLGIEQRCFAIKHGANGLLDMVRKTYSERVDSLREYVKELGNKYNMSLTLQNTTKNGYHITFPLTNQQKRTLSKSDLPSEFVYVERTASSFLLKTEELNNRSTRIDEILTEIFNMSNQIIHYTLIKIKEYLPLFYELCEIIAKLDMIQSLAQASKDCCYVRPQFKNFMELINSRHPLLEYLCSNSPIANDVLASPHKNMFIITGPNGSGKSIYIRQILLLQVMAQVGSFVPAESAIFRISDRILARVYLEDKLDYGSSAFVLEITEMECFLKILTKNTLLIIDELGRSTGEGEGTALAFAIAEKLAQTQAYTFLTTHFKFLTNLSNLYYNIENLHLETQEINSEQGTMLKYSHTVKVGVCNLEQYALHVVKLSWSADILKYARGNVNKLQRNINRCAEIDMVQRVKKIKYDLEGRLYILKQKNVLTRAAINKELSRLEKELQMYNIHLNLLDITKTNSSIGRNNIESVVFSNNSTRLHRNENNACLGPERLSMVTSEPEYYYIPPEVVYSPSIGDLTTDFSDFRNLSGLIQEKSLHAVNSTTPYAYNNNYREFLGGQRSNTLESPGQPCNIMVSDTSTSNIYEIMLDEDMDLMEEFSRNFDENSISDNFHPSKLKEGQHQILDMRCIEPALKLVENSTANADPVINVNYSLTQNSQVSQALTNETVLPFDCEWYRHQRCAVNINNTTDIDTNVRDNINNSANESSFSTYEAAFGRFIAGNRDTSTPIASMQKDIVNSKVCTTEKDQEENVENPAGDIHEKLNSTLCRENPFDDTNISETLAKLQSTRDINRGDGKSQTSNENKIDNGTSTEVQLNSSTLECSSKNMCESADKVTPGTSTTDSSMKAPLENKVKRKRPRFKTPLKQCDWNQYGQKSKQQIRRELEEQSRIMRESCQSEDNYQKYLAYLQNRPTVSQVQEVTTVAMMHKTDDGVVVTPVNKPPLKKRKTEFVSTSSFSSSEQFDPSIFSDEQSERTERFLRDKSTNLTIFDFCKKHSHQNPLMEHPLLSRNHKDAAVTSSIAVKQKHKSEQAHVTEQDNANSTKTNESLVIEQIRQKYLKPLNENNSTSTSIFSQSTIILDT